MIDKNTKVIIHEPKNIDLENIHNSVNVLYCYWIEKLLISSNLDKSIKYQLLEEFINDFKSSI